MDGADCRRARPARLRSMGDDDGGPQATQRSTVRRFQQAAAGGPGSASAASASWTRAAFVRSAEDVFQPFLFDSSHSPQNIAAYAFCLGALFGGGLSLALPYLVSSSWSSFALYLASMGTFHFLEYLMTALYNPHKLSLDSFLINHSTEYSIAFACASIEFLLEWFLVPWTKNSVLLRLIGFILVVVGQGLRTGAMLTAKANFSHQIVERKEENHVLVTDGIYKFVRHPSYCGFFLWSVGTQVMLSNPVCLIGFAVASWRFFSSRIEFEEHTLIQFFGQDYRDYKRKVWSGIPLIP